MAGRVEFSSGKFKELVLLFTDRSADDPLMSRVKLNKLLYYADFEAYRRLGHAITGATYVKGEFGPMAAELPLAEEELGRAGYLTWRIDESGSHVRKIPVAREKPDEGQFAGEELDIVAEALFELKELGGAGARDWSHKNSAGWNLVEDEAPIPYSTAFISTEQIPSEDIDRARQLGLERNWAEIRP
jgi:Protein of unknown function (DUF4065)